MSRPKALTPEQAEEVRRRYDDGKRNRPVALAREFGISVHTVVSYARRRHKERRA